MYSAALRDGFPAQNATSCMPMILSAILVHLSQKEMDWKQNSKVSQEKTVIKNTSKPFFHHA